MGSSWIARMLGPRRKLSTSSQERTSDDIKSGMLRSMEGRAQAQVAARRELNLSCWVLQYC